MTATERHPTSLQCWPGGKTVYYSGDPHGPDLRTHAGYADTVGTPATDDDRKAIRIELRAKQYMDQEILCCDSALVDKLLEDNYDGFTWEEVENLRVDPSEWSLEQCREWLEDNGHDLPDPNPWAMDRDELIACHLERVGTEVSQNFPEDAASVRSIVLCDLEDNIIDDYRDAVRDNAEDATVFQWFRVTPWFCEQLREAGEVVLDNNYGEWWGRQCAGQSIIMDGTLQRVATNQEE